MPETHIYSLLLQAYHADKSAARLLHALAELAGRLETAEGSIDADSKLQDSSRTWTDLTSLRLPDPAAGPLPLLPGACEHAALQEATDSSRRALTSTAARHTWKSWAMRPQHMVHVVEAAWLLVASVFRQDDACAAALQVHVRQQIQQHHVSAALSGQEPVEGCSQLWTQTLADAACRLLRTAFPAVLELQDKKLQELLQRQLRLYTTGLLPSEAAAPALQEATQQHLQQAPGPKADPQADHTAPPAADVDSSRARDAAARPAACKRSSCSNDPAKDMQRQAEHPRRSSAQFLSVKPGAAVSAFMAKQGLQPAPDLLQAQAGELTRITLPAHLLQKQQEAAGAAVEAACSNQHQLYSFSAQCDDQHGSSTATSSSSDGTHRAKATACMAAASEAVEAYERGKAAAAASVQASRLSAQMAVHSLQKQRVKAIAAGPSKAKETSNMVSGWLSQTGACTVVATTKPAQGLPAKACSSSNSGKPTSKPASAGISSGGGSSSSSSSSKLTATDAQCKAQRQLLEHQLRGSDWRMAQALSASLHDRCTNMAAAVATLPPAPITPMPPSGAAAAAGQDWGALVSSSVARHHAGKGGGGAGLAGSRSDIKVMKAARAIVEDVQRAFAASSSPPVRKNRH